MAWGTSLSIFTPLVSDRAEYSNVEETGQLSRAGSRLPHRHSQSCREHCWGCRHTWYIRQGPGRKQMACSKRLMRESWMKGLFTEVWAALHVWKQWSWYQPSTVHSTRPEGTGSEQAAWRELWPSVWGAQTALSDPTGRESEERHYGLNFVATPPKFLLKP